MTTNRTTTITGKGSLRWTVATAFVSAVLVITGTLHARLMIVGNDEKTTWDDQGKQLFFPGRAKDSVCLVDLGGDPLAPKIVATLPLENSVYGPPTNLAIAPDEKLAFVAPVSPAPCAACAETFRRE